MIYQTTRFGVLELNASDIIHFPQGLYAFEQETEFALLPLDPHIDSPMQWLQSLKTPALAFVVTDPFIYIPEYKVVLTEEERKQIKIEDKNNLEVRVIVTIPENYREMTANLVAPLVINMDQGIGKQAVLTSNEYDTRHHLLSQDSKVSKVRASN